MPVRGLCSGLTTVSFPVSEMAGKMSAKIIGVNSTGKAFTYKETAEAIIKEGNFSAFSLCQDEVIQNLNTRNFL
jgi:hypothetical protein